MPQTVTFRESWPGVYGAHARFDKRLNAILKGHGDQQAIYWFDFRAELGTKRWYVPLERLDCLMSELGSYGYVCEIKHRRGIVSKDLPSDLLPHQEDAVKLALMHRVRLLQFDTGLGKTLTALAVAQQCGGKTLIVAPRIVLSNWPKEIEKWGLLNTEDLWEQRSGRKIPDEQPSTVLCSYGSLHHLPVGWRYDCMIYDEIHYAIHARSKRSAELRKLSIHNQDAVRLGLTATPTSAETHNIHGVLHALCPYRYGSWWQWSRRYHHITPTGFEGRDEVGPVSDPEGLAETLAAVTSVATQANVGYNLLPPVDWSIEKLPGAREQTGKLSREGWFHEQQELSELRAAVVSNYFQAKTIEKTAIVCYLRETANGIGKALGVQVVSGDTIAHKRARLLEGCDSVVLTMRSANEGIDLRKFTNVYIVEAYPVPCYMEQVIGRFVRMHAKAPVSITFLALCNTSDIIVCARLAERLKEQAAVNTQNTTKTKLLGMMKAAQQSDTWLEDLAAQLDDADWESEDDGWG